MPVYNTPDIKALERSVYSVLNQDFGDFEFIICDDCSNEYIPDFLKSLSDPRIILLTNEKNIGLAASLNKCIEIAKGKYILRQDDDDFSEPDRFRKQVEFLENNPDTAAAGSNVSLFDDSGKWGVLRYPEKPGKKDFLFMIPFMHGALAFRKDKLVASGCYLSSKTTRRTQDYELLMRMYSLGYTGYNIQEELYGFREDMSAHKRRKYIYRIDEFKTRLRGFKSLGLMPAGFIYAVKPLAVGLIPYRPLNFLKDVFLKRKKIKTDSKKILYIASAASHIINFHSGYLKELREMGFEVHAAAGGDISGAGEINADKIFELDFEKNKNLLKNIFAVYKLRKIIRRERYTILSAHATLAGIAGRLAALFYKKSRFIQTCHGYLFADDGSLKSKLMILTEKLLSHRTDLLFVMNIEDYGIAKKYKLSKNIKYIDGMGLIPPERYSGPDILKKYNIPENKKYLLCVGEFSKRKSQRDIINALKLIKDIKDLHVIFLGGGVLLEECRNLCGMQKILGSVTFCGNVKETAAFYEIAYCVVSASKSEGLPFNILEALWFNKPVIASDVKGHKDLIKDNFNGYLFGYGDCGKLAAAIEKIADGVNCNNLKSNAYLDEKYFYRNVKAKILEEYRDC